MFEISPEPAREAASSSSSSPPFDSLTARIWSAATALRVFGEIEQPIEAAMQGDTFVLKAGNTFCKLIFDRSKDAITGSFGWYGPSFEVTARELFTFCASTFENGEVLAELIIVEFLRALTDPQSQCQRKMGAGRAT